MALIGLISISFLSSLCASGVVSGVSGQYQDSHKLIHGLRLAFNVYRQCDKQDLMICLKMRALKLIDRASNSKSIPIYDGVILVKSSDIDSRSFSEKHPIEDALIREDEQKIDDILKRKFMKFMETHSVQLRVPKTISDGIKEIREYLQIDDDSIEGRDKKKKKMGQFVMWAMMVKGAMIAMFFKGLAIVSGTALVASKVALTLASIIAIKALFSSGHSAHEKTTYEIVKTPVVSNSHQYSSSSHVGSDWAGGGEFEAGGPYARTLELSGKPSYPFPYQQDNSIYQSKSPEMKPSPIDHTQYNNY